jgi:hypothetical protein
MKLLSQMSTMQYPSVRIASGRNNVWIDANVGLYPQIEERNKLYNKEITQCFLINISSIG